MKPTDLTIEILKGIRDEGRKTNERIDKLNSDLTTRIDQTNERLEHMNSDLGARIDHVGRCVVESEIRTATALTDVAGNLREVAGMLREMSDLRPRVEKAEHDIAKLTARLDA